MLKRITDKILRSNDYIKPIEDDFVKRINSLVIGSGMLHPGNIHLMEKAIENMPTSGVILEIGSYGGLSANLIIHLCQRYKQKEKIISCDPWMYEGYQDHTEKMFDHIDGRTDIKRSEYSEYMKCAYKSACKFLSPDRMPYGIESTSDEFFKSYSANETLVDVFDRSITLGESIAFAYIDGNHAYDFAKRDFQNVNKHLLVGGYILFDDSYDGAGFGSEELMKEVKTDPNYLLVAKNPNYLFKKVG